MTVHNQIIAIQDPNQILIVPMPSQYQTMITPSTNQLLQPAMPNMGMNPLLDPNNLVVQATLEQEATKKRIVSEDAPILKTLDSVEVLAPLVLIPQESAAAHVYLVHSCGLSKCKLSDAPTPR